MKIIKGVLHEEINNGIFEYDRPSKIVAVEAEAPSAKWLGEKFPYDQWRQIIGFFVDSYKETKAEAMVRMYYNQELKLWKTHAFPQEYSGLAVTDKTDDKQFEEYIGDGFVLAATAHHHCSAGAFQSGQDKDDEKTKNGVHITVGNLDKYPFDFDCRISISKKMFESAIDDFIDIPMNVLGNIKVNADFINAYKEQMLCQSLDYPKIWMQNVEEKKYSTLPYRPATSLYSSRPGSEDAFDKFETNYLGRKNAPSDETEYSDNIDIEEMKNELADANVEAEYANSVLEEVRSAIFDPTSTDSDKLWAAEQILSGVEFRN